MCIYISLYMCVYIWVSLVSSAGREFTCNAGDPGLIPGSGRSSREGMGYPFQYSWASLVAQLVKNPPPMWDTWARSLGWKDPLEKGMATHSIFLPGEFHGLYSSWGRKEFDTTEQLSLSCIYTCMYVLYVCISCICVLCLYLGVLCLCISCVL